MIAYARIIVTNEENIKKNKTTRSNISTVMTEWVKMCCKSVTYNLFKVAGLLVVNSTVIEKPMGYIEAYLYISQT